VTSALLRAARVVGDFGNPFYEEERQRDVWNEASAFGLQLVLWLGLGGCAVAVWTGGRGSLPYVVGALVVLGVASAGAVVYALALGVEPTSGVRVLRPRMVPYLVLVALVAAGLVHTGGSSTSFGRGLLVGAGCGTVVLAVAGRVRRR
jgi:hypothetical protein